MRRYDIVSGILLILSIIDFALAAPVLVQEEHQAGVDVVHIPEHVITVLGKRGDAEELEKLMEKYFRDMGNPGESSDAHASSSSAPPRPDHGWTNIVQAPGPNQASSTANLGLLIEPSSPSLVQGASGDLLPEDPWSLKGDDESDGSLFTSGSSAYHTDSDRESTGAHAPRPNPNPNPRPSTNPDPDFDWNYWMSLEDPPLPPRPAQPKEIGLAPEYQEHVYRPNPGPYPNPGYLNPNLADEYFKPSGNPVESSDAYASSSSAPAGPDHESTNVVQSAPASNPASSTANPDPLVEPSSPSSTAPMQGSWDHLNALWDDLWLYKPGAHVPQPNSKPRPSTDLDLEDPPPPRPESPKEPEYDAVQAAIYAAKGKAKLLRRISGTARDVGNAVERELQPAGRSLDTGDFCHVPKEQDIGWARWYVRK